MVLSVHGMCARGGKKKTRTFGIVHKAPVRVNLKVSATLLLHSTITTMLPVSAYVAAKPYPRTVDYDDRVILNLNATRGIIPSACPVHRQ